LPPAERRPVDRGSVPVTIRPEAPGDEAAIRAVHDAAFGGSVEGGIVDALRGSDASPPGFSLVAVDGGRVVGHVLMARAVLERVDAPPARIVVLGPIGVLPDRQGEGIGTSLMQRAIGAAVARAEPLIALLGHASYYPRFGFEPARPLGLEPPAPWPDEAWMALRLPPWTPELRGTVRFPDAYPMG
jgi:putative acetyltransferase